MIEAFLGSGGPFLITFRESLEAALIIGIIAAYLKKTGKGEFTKYLYIGAVAAIVASIAIGGILAVFYVTLEGGGEMLFEGTAAILAASVLTYVIFWMAKNAYTIKEKLQKRVEAAVSKGYVIGLAFVAFIAVFREGIETVLFLTATGVQNPVGTIAGAAAGIALVIFLTVLMFKKIYSMNIEKFFQYSSILLIIFAAGLLGSGVHEFIEVADGSEIDLGFFSSQAYNINPALHEKGALGSILKSIVGYDGNPEWLRVIVYLAYWVAVGLYVLVVYKPENRIARVFKRQKPINAEKA